MTTADQIACAIEIELDSPEEEINAKRLQENLLKIFAVTQTTVDNLVAPLSKLISSESALTIPLSDGCVAKVRFSQPVTRKHMQAFSAIFQSITENYVVREDGE